MTISRVAVLGLGYVGLPSAAVFAGSGLTVIGVDINASTVKTINEGRAHFIEPGLDELLARVVGDGRLRATTKVEPADVFVIAVPTPFTNGNKPDLRFVEAATRMIAPVLARANTVILESTSPVGATERVAGWLRSERPDLAVPERDGAAGDIHLAYCPERILPGNVIEELVQNDRVIGGMTTACSQAAVTFYEHVVEGHCYITNARTAELCKLSENSFRDVNIAFANELSMIADHFGIDIRELIALTNRHPRVNILNPGPGVGGHCIAVDPWFIVDGAPDQSRLIRTAREVNDSKPEWVIAKVADLAARVDRLDPLVVCMGLAYKPDIDDLRESPSTEVTMGLAARGDYRVAVCDPFIEALPSSLRDAGVVLLDPIEAVERADILVFLTAHTQFSKLDLRQFSRGRIFDACGIVSGAGP